LHGAAGEVGAQLKIGKGGVMREQVGAAHADGID